MRRTVPMTETLFAALNALRVVREGLVIRNPDGSQKPDGETDHAIASAAALACRFATGTRCGTRSEPTLRSSA